MAPFGQPLHLRFKYPRWATVRGVGTDERDNMSNAHCRAFPVESIYQLEPTLVIVQILRRLPITSDVVIVQPYLPAYRVPLFQSLVDILKRDGIECRVAASHPPGTLECEKCRATGDGMREPR